MKLSILDPMEYVVAGLILFILVLLVVGVVAAQKEQEAWEAYAAAHNCKVVGKAKGHASTGVGMVGKNVMVTTTTAPDQTAYLCDDGITYWR